MCKQTSRENGTTAVVNNKHNVKLSIIKRHPHTRSFLFNDLGLLCIAVLIVRSRWIKLCHITSVHYICKENKSRLKYSIGKYVAPILLFPFKQHMFFQAVSSLALMSSTHKAFTKGN